VKRILGSLIGLLVLLNCVNAMPDTVTTGSLVREMIDLQRLGDFPDPSYKTVQFSSYDHRSTLPGGPEWFANSDGFGKEPKANFEDVIKKPGSGSDGEYLICDVDGPGAIVRVWTAAIKGNIRMYLDDSRKPVYDGTAQDFLQKTYKPYLSQAGMDDKRFDGAFFQRNAGYYPVPFAKKCRIVWIGNKKDIHFYQIQIRLYEKDAVVKTFAPEDLSIYKEDIEETIDVLKDPDLHWDYASTDKPLPISAIVKPGENQEVLFQDGPKAIERLTLCVKAGDIDKALRQTILHIHFDEYPWGQVQSPIGDFFGVAPGINPYDSIPFTVKSDGEMVCRFVMPFKSNVRIMLENKGAQPVAVSGAVQLMDYDWDDDSSMHFRARWRVDHDLVASNDTVQDLPFLIANGKGVYVGTASYLLNPNNVPSSYGNWWGEGDEKIFVDDDIQPSTFGTGSEDYYNYAWSSGDIFTFPYFAQPRNDGPANRGFVTNNRWHIVDPLPFEYRLSFYMELFSHETTPGVSYARMSYHYGKPGMMDDHLPITGEDVRHLTLPANWEPASRMGAMNSVFLPAETLVESTQDIDFVYDNLWQGGALMVWRPGVKGQGLDMKFTVEEDGKYTIRLACARTPRSGIFSVKIDNALLDSGGKIDLFDPYRILLRSEGSKKVELKKGEHRLNLQFEGKCGASHGTEIGIDFLWLQK